MMYDIDVFNGFIKRVIDIIKLTLVLDLYEGGNRSRNLETVVSPPTQTHLENETRHKTR